MTVRGKNRIEVVAIVLGIRTICRHRDSGWPVSASVVGMGPRSWPRNAWPVGIAIWVGMVVTDQGIRTDVADPHQLAIGGSLAQARASVRLGGFPVPRTLVLGRHRATVGPCVAARRWFGWRFRTAAARVWISGTHVLAGLGWRVPLAVQQRDGRPLWPRRLD